jgi:hypothetical protein
LGPKIRDGKARLVKNLGGGVAVAPAPCQLPRLPGCQAGSRQGKLWARARRQFCQKGVQVACGARA